MLILNVFVNARFNPDILYATIIRLLPTPPAETFTVSEVAVSSASSGPRVQFTSYNEIYSGIRALDPSLDLEQRTAAAMQQQPRALTHEEAFKVTALLFDSYGI